MASASSGARAWAASGAMALTGRSEATGLVPPDGLIGRLRSLGEPLGIDPLPLLGERAAALRLGRRGAVSCGGSARLVRALDDWIVVNLAREDDEAAVPAWLHVDAVPVEPLPEGPGRGDPWTVIESTAAQRPASALVEQAALLGLPCARLGEARAVAPGDRLGSLPVAATSFGSGSKGEPARVVDLSSLWAGPLCSRLLADRGAEVTKVEAVKRPDGARRGPAAFFDRMNAGKRSVALDLTTTDGIDHLRMLLRRADVVIEASRPRALRQMGIVAEDMLTAEYGPSIWISITGHGRGHDRVAFGDDAAVAGGLVARDEQDRPCFVADAVADPLAGIAAASAVTGCEHAGGRWLVDVSMAAVAAFVVGPDRGVRWRSTELEAVPPHAPPSCGAAPELGSDTAAVLAELRAGTGMTVHLREVEVDGERTNVAIDRNGILAVDASLRPSRRDLVIDGHGGALLPGLHDHHLHLAALAAAMSSTFVGPPSVRDPEDLAGALRAADAAAEPDVWLRAVGYHERVAGDLDRGVLDRLVPHRPLRVQHRSGALWIVNSAGLAHLGLLGGSVPHGCELDAEGAPTGRLWRLDRWLGERLDAPPPAFGAVGAHLLSQGITGVTDMTPYAHADDFRAIADAVAAGHLPQRVTVTGAPDLDVASLPPGLDVGPAKVLLTDHELPSLDELLSVMRQARHAGRAIAVHCVTRVSLVLTLTAFDEIGTRAGDRIEHGAVIPRPLDEMISRLGLTVVTQPNFVAERGDEYLTSVDRDDLDDLWRCGSLLDAGIAVGAGTDAPFGRADPWALVAAATDRRTHTGTVLQPGERVPPLHALALLLGAPEAPGGPIRRVAVGQPSDLCLLAEPLHDALTTRGRNPVRLVLRAGCVVHGDAGG